VLSFNLPLDVICTSHGVIWRDKPEQIVEKYLKWADNYQENQITIIYDTMWNGTRVMAEKIANGISNAGNEEITKIRCILSLTFRPIPWATRIYIQPHLPAASKIQGQSN
jgi:flavorubredoxin